MIAAALKFPAGRFHATPWGRHVNEAAPEWPPSPWRLLRSLVATWKGKLDGSLSPERVETILRTLSHPPEFSLPKATTAHSRHYMPWDKAGKTLIFDGFVVLERGSEVIMHWPDANLSPEERSVLGLLFEYLGFLGRAESWCEARLLEETEATSAVTTINSRPLSSGIRDDDSEVVRVLCVDADTAFLNQHTPKARVSSRKGKNKITTEQPHYNPDWHLCVETLWLHEQRWSDAPGSQWVQYTRPRDCFKADSARRVKRSVTGREPQVVRFAIDSTVLPLVTETLPVAEAARRVLMGIFGRKFPKVDGSKGRSDVLSGKDEDGNPLSNHEHAFYLPTDEDRDGRLDHLTLVATRGFGAEEMRTLDEFEEIKTHDRVESGHPLRVVLLGFGRLPEYQPGPLSPSLVWQSATPFVAPRFPKKNGTKRDPEDALSSPAPFTELTLREELTRWLGRHPETAGISLDQVEIKQRTDDANTFRLPGVEGALHGPRPLQFKRFRQKRDDDGGRRSAGAFIVTFPSKVAGPIALGHSAHFGLGLFVPA